MKEIIAVAILAALIVLTALDIHMVNKLTDELTEIIAAAESERDVEQAIELWHREEWFTNVALRHSEIDLVTAELYSLKRDISGENPAVARERTLARIACIRDMEQINFGTIF